MDKGSPWLVIAMIVVILLYAYGDAVATRQTQKCVSTYGWPVGLCRAVQDTRTRLSVEGAAQLYEAFSYLSDEAWDGLAERLSYAPIWKRVEWTGISYMLDPARREWAWDSILRGHVRVGMTAAQAEFAWGPPTTINRTVTAYGVREQWVYGSHAYLYFENGVLTTFTTRR